MIGSRGRTQLAVLFYERPGLVDIFQIGIVENGGGRDVRGDGRRIAGILMATTGED